MQCVLQCPTVEMITQKETRGEFSLHKLFNSSSHIYCSNTSYMQSDSLVALLGTFSDQLLKSCSHAVKSFLGVCAGKNPQAWRALMMAWSLLNENSKWSVSLHFLELSVPVNAGCLDAGIPLLHVHSQNVSRKLWERVGVVSLDILGDKNTTKYITHQTFLPNLQKLGFLMWSAVQQPLPASCHATYRWNAVSTAQCYHVQIWSLPFCQQPTW